MRPKLSGTGADRLGLGAVPGHSLKTARLLWRSASPLNSDAEHRRRRPGFSTFATAGADVHMHQCLVAAFILACARKKRIISRLASGPRASV
jgi:hypothetical protein